MSGEPFWNHDGPRATDPLETAGALPRPAAGEAVLAGHRLWSYADPGTAGYVNPEGMDAEGDTRETLLLRARSTVEMLRDENHMAQRPPRNDPSCRLEQAPRR